MTVIGPIDSEHDTLDVGLPLHITWQHGWHVTPLKGSETANAGRFLNSGNSICVPAEEMKALAVAQLTGWEESGLTVPDGAAGCFIQGRALTGQSIQGADPNSYGPLNYLLYRFGVLLAANVQAHRTFPTLPLASASEQSLAQQLATQS